MPKSPIILKQPDGFSVKLYPFLSNNDSPTANIVLLTGMNEHYGRYNNFIKFLNSNGFDVYTYDHRGQGKEYSIKDLGYIAPKNGHMLLINDALSVVDYVSDNGRGNKTFIIGHSMGSIITRVVIQNTTKLDGAIVMSTAYEKPSVYFFAKIITGTVLLFKAGHNPAQYFTKKVFDSKNYNSFGNRTSYDWLSRDVNAVGAYIHDPYCGYICSIGFYHDLASLSYMAALKKNILKTSRSLPILFVAGTKDPVGNMGKGVSRLFDVYKSNNFTNIRKIMYKDCRHELLNELNCDHVMEDILNWLES